MVAAHATGRAGRLAHARIRALGRGWSGALYPCVLVLVVFASRLPYLRPGYGTDPDAYRVVLAARALRGGDYAASRLPGYPLHELLTALLLPGGPRWVNGASALASALAALGLFKLGTALRLSPARAGLSAFAFAFTPVVFQNSTSSIDYVWSICCVLWSGHTLVTGHTLRAGLLLGAAIGMRITAGAMLLPWLVLQHAVISARGDAGDLITPTPHWREALRLCLATLASGALCFSPVLYTYGLGFWEFVDHDLSWPTIITRASSEVWGTLGVWAWCGVLAIALLARRELLAALRRAPSLALAAALAVALFGVAFLRLPNEAGYLIPCVPFLLLLTAAFLPVVAIAQLALLLALSCFVGLDERGLNLSGPMPATHAYRVALNARATRVLQRGAAIPGKALIIAGSLLPWLDVKRANGEQPGHLYLYLLQSEEELRGYLREGYELYFVDRAVERRQQRESGISLRASGGRSIL